MRRASPYRTQPPSIELEPCKTPAARARFTISRGAWAASFAAHAAVLGALSLAPTSLNAIVPLDPDEPPSEDQELYVHAEESRPAFPSPWDHVWFDGIGPFVLEPPWHDDPYLPASDAVECLSGPEDGWARIDSPNFPERDHDFASRSMSAAASECVDHAARKGWRGRGRVFVRASRRDDGAAIATTTPLDDDARYEALLCCLRQAQAPMASMLRQGGAVRFVMVFGVDPAQSYVRIENTAASRGNGGPEALAVLQSAFSK